MASQRQCMHVTEPKIDLSWLPFSQALHQPQVYDVRFPRKTTRCPCPFPGCLGSSHAYNVLRYRFNRHHWGDRIRILEEHPNPLSRCEQCRSQVPGGKLNNRHYTLDKCNQGEEKRLRRKTLQRCLEESWVLFHIKNKTLTPSEAFPYLGQKIAYRNSDSAVVHLKLCKSWRRW